MKKLLVIVIVSLKIETNELPDSAEPLFPLLGLFALAVAAADEFKLSKLEVLTCSVVCNGIELVD